MDNYYDNNDKFSEETATEELIEETNDVQELDYDEEEGFFGGGDKTYVKKADKYDDVKSSAFTMLIVGTIGILFIFLSISKIINIPFNETTAWLFYSIMCAVFAAFVIAGFVSYRRAAILKEEADVENKKIDEINAWANENITVSYIDIGLDTNETVELLYFARADKIKDMLMHQFEDVDEGLIDLLTENIYQKLYEPNEYQEDSDEESNTDLSDTE